MRRARAFTAFDQAGARASADRGRGPGPRSRGSGSDRAEGARLALPARARGAGAGRGGAFERGDRGAPVHQHEDRRQPRQQHPGQAARPEPDRGRGDTRCGTRAGFRRRDREPSRSFPRRSGAARSAHGRKEEVMEVQRRGTGRANALQARARRSGGRRPRWLRPRSCTTCLPTSGATSSGAADAAEEELPAALDRGPGGAGVGRDRVLEHGSGRDGSVRRLVGRHRGTSARSAFEFVTEARLSTKKGEVVEWTHIHRYEIAPRGRGMSGLVHGSGPSASASCRACSGCSSPWSSAAS